MHPGRILEISPVLGFNYIYIEITAFLNVDTSDRIFNGFKNTFKFFVDLFYIIHMSILLAFMFVYHVHACICGGQTRASYSQEMEVWVVVSYHADTVFQKSNKGHLFSPQNTL